jgi:hypothetical protein
MSRPRLIDQKIDQRATAVLRTKTPGTCHQVRAPLSVFGGRAAILRRRARLIAYRGRSYSIEVRVWQTAHDFAWLQTGKISKILKC